MRKFGILFFILLIFILNCEDTKDEKRSTKSGEHPLIELVKINAKTLIQNVDLSKEVSDNEILDLLWGGNGIVKTVKTKDKKTIETFSHPVNFTNLIDLYYINKNGLYYYNYKKNKLKILKNGDLIKKLNLSKKLNYRANSYIILSLNPDIKKFHSGIDRLKGRVKKGLLEKVKSNYELEEIRKSAIIEAGTAVKNIMLLATSHNFVHFPVNVQNNSKTLIKAIGIKKTPSEIFMIIPIGEKKDGAEKSSAGDFVKKLIKNCKNSNKKDFNLQNGVDPKIMYSILWFANGLIKNKDTKISAHLGLPESLIQIYYITNKQVQKYDPFTNSLMTIKFGDFRAELSSAARKYKAKDNLIIAINISNKISNNGKLSDLKSIDHKKAINNYSKIAKSSLINDLAMFQVGLALQSIRLMITDFNLAYQHIDIQPKDREKMAKILSFRKGDIPVFIIPIGNKK